MKNLKNVISERLKRQPSIHKLLRRYLILASVIPILILGFYYYESLVSSVESNYTYHRNQTFAIIKERISHYNDTQSKTLLLFVSSPQLQELLKLPDSQTDKDQRILDIILQYDSVYGEGYSLALGLENGQMYSAHASKLPTDYDPRTRPWYKDSLLSTNGYVLSDPYPDARNPELLSVTYSMQVIDSQNQQRIGVAGMDVNLSDLFGEVEFLNLPEGSLLAIHDQSGRLLTGNFPTADALKHYTVHHEPIKDNRWVATLYWPNSASDALKTQIFLPAFIAVVLCFVFSLYYAFLIDQRLMLPVDELISQLKQVNLDDEQHDYSTYITLSVKESTLEIEALKTTIYSMLTRIYNQGTDLIDKRQELTRQYMEIEALYEESTAMNDSLNDMVDTLNESWRQTIRVLSNAIEANDYYTKGHCDRVTTIGLDLGSAMQLSKEHLLDLEFAALLHDVGKIAVPHQILNKLEPLTSDEWQQIAQHPSIGYTIIRDVTFLVESARIIRHHHERFDGKGYPDSLVASQIPLSSRILTVADAYDAMTTARAYRKTPLTHAEALVELKKNSGTQFDPEIVSQFVKLYSDIPPEI